MRRVNRRHENPRSNFTAFSNLKLDMILGDLVYVILIESGDEIPLVLLSRRMWRADFDCILEERLCNGARDSNGTCWGTG